MDDVCKLRRDVMQLAGPIYPCPPRDQRCSSRVAVTFTMPAANHRITGGGGGIRRARPARHRRHGTQARSASCSLPAATIRGRPQFGSTSTSRPPAWTGRATTTVPVDGAAELKPCIYELPHRRALRGRRPRRMCTTMLGLQRIREAAPHGRPANRSDARHDRIRTNVSVVEIGCNPPRSWVRIPPRARSLKSAYYQRITVNESFMSSDKRGVNSSPCMGLIHLFDQTLMSQ